MRSLCFVFLVLITYRINGQDNNFYELAGPDNYYPENFDRTAGTKMVIVVGDCAKCPPIRRDEHGETFVFNSQGFNVERYSLSKGRKWGMQKYFWNTDGTINRYQNYSTYQDTMEDSATYENDYGMVWDSTLLTSEVRYTYGPNKKVEKIVWLNGDDLSTELVVTFHYDSKGRVIKEELVDFPDKGDVILGFNPNTTETIELPDAKTQIARHKLFKYSGDTVFIEYYDKGQLSGRGKQAVDKRGLLTYVATFNMTGELLFQIINVFNDRGNLVDQRMFQTGYNGYGDGLDFAVRDRRTFEYDKSGRLMRVVGYYKDEVLSSATFEYR